MRYQTHDTLVMKYSYEMTFCQNNNLALLIKLPSIDTKKNCLLFCSNFQRYLLFSHFQTNQLLKWMGFLRGLINLFFKINFAQMDGISKGVN